MYKHAGFKLIVSNLVKFIHCLLESPAVSAVTSQLNIYIEFIFSWQAILYSCTATGNFVKILYFMQEKYYYLCLSQYQATKGLHGSKDKDLCIIV